MFGVRTIIEFIYALVILTTIRPYLPELAFCFHVLGLTLMFDFMLVPGRAIPYRNRVTYIAFIACIMFDLGKPPPPTYWWGWN